MAYDSMGVAKYSAPRQAILGRGRLIMRSTPLLNLKLNPLPNRNKKASFVTGGQQMEGLHPSISLMTKLSLTC